MALIPNAKCQLSKRSGPSAITQLGWSFTHGVSRIDTKDPMFSDM